MALHSVLRNRLKCGKGDRAQREPPALGLGLTKGPGNHPRSSRSGCSPPELLNMALFPISRGPAQSSAHDDSWPHQWILVWEFLSCAHIYRSVNLSICLKTRWFFFVVHFLSPTLSEMQTVTEQTTFCDWFPSCIMLGLPNPHCFPPPFQDYISHDSMKRSCWQMQRAAPAARCCVVLVPQHGTHALPWCSGPGTSWDSKQTAQGRQCPRRAWARSWKRGSITKARTDVEANSSASHMGWRFFLPVAFLIEVTIWAQGFATEAWPQGYSISATVSSRVQWEKWCLRTSGKTVRFADIKLLYKYLYV